MAVDDNAFDDNAIDTGVTWPTTGPLAPRPAPGPSAEALHVTELLADKVALQRELEKARDDAELLHELLDVQPPVIFLWEFANGQFYVTDKDFPPVQGRGAVTERASVLLAKRSKK